MKKTELAKKLGKLKTKSAVAEGIQAIKRDSGVDLSNGGGSRAMYFGGRKLKVRDTSEHSNKYSNDRIYGKDGKMQSKTLRFTTKASFKDKGSN